MAKIFIYPATSLILTDMVTRFGHTPLSSATAVRERIQTAGLESVPLQITPEEPKKGLRWAAVEVPSGVRGATFDKERRERWWAARRGGLDGSCGCSGGRRERETESV
jgi:hypothetical protein